MTDLDAHLPAGTRILLSQACAEPTLLVDAVLDRADSGVALEVFVGASWHERLVDDPPSALTVFSYGALGGLRRLARHGRLNVVPCNFSDLPRLFAERRLPIDVAMIQVSPPGPDGMCSLGVGVDYVGDAYKHAQVVIAEVNARMPVTVGGPRIPWDRLDVTIETDRPLVEAPHRDPDDVDRAIAEGVAALVDDGSTLQLGIGPLPDAIGSELAGHRDLGVHSGMISDAVLDLAEAGALSGRHEALDRGIIVTGAALGSQRLFDRLDDLAIEFRPVSYTHAPATLAGLPGLVAINSAVQVDMTGQANAEVRDGTYVGAIGGQPEFARAASRTGAVSVIALRSTSRGCSTIVLALEDGVVTTPRADVDVVVTEHGVAHLRGRTLEQRRRAMLGVAAPEHRDDLTRALTG